MSLNDDPADFDSFWMEFGEVLAQIDQHRSFATYARRYQDALNDASGFTLYGLCRDVRRDLRSLGHVVDHLRETAEAYLTAAELIANDAASSTSSGHRQQQQAAVVPPPATRGAR